MNVNFDLSRKSLIIYAAVCLLAVGLYFWSGYPPAVLFGFAISYFVIRTINISVTDKAPWIWRKTVEKLGKKILFLEKIHVSISNILGWIVSAALFIAGPVFSTWCVQHVILESELFKKTKKSVLKLNVLCVLVVYLLLLLVIARVKWAWITAHCFFLTAAFADYFVYEFRENEITYADIRTIGTGLSVAKNYRFSMPVRGAVIILLSILAIAIVRKFRFRFRHRWLVRILAACLILWLAHDLDPKLDRKITQTWEKKGSYRNGFVVNFVLGFRDSFVDPPEDYSLDEIHELEETYRVPETEGDSPADSEPADLVLGADDAEGGSVGAGTQVSTAGPAKKPTIITIMNESFADYRLVGDLKTNMEVMPFIDSLKENTVKGFALSSVYGAKTPNSEWEYMSGNTMAFLPDGSVVYQQFLDDKPTSIVSTLKNEGYTAIAMHPYFKAGWSRNTVYPDLGFDEMRFMDTGDFDETKLMRKYITDQELYDKIIDRFEQKGEDEPLFIMGITMQNHGGYRDEYDNFVSDVQTVGGKYYGDANQYLSLIRQTDLATASLIDYFSRVDEPVEIVFFGDHYPSLSSGFVRTLNGKGISGLTLTELQRLFSVPFFIWTNYPTQEDTVPRTSLNFLGTMVLERAGIPLTPYYRFLKELQEHIPAINARGYFSLSKGKYRHVEDAEGEEKEWLDKYNMLEYNSMFDKKNRSELFFPYITE